MPDCPYCDNKSQADDDLTVHLDEGHSREELSRVDRKRVETHAARSGGRSRLGRVVPDGRLSRRATIVAAGTAFAGIGVGIGRRMASSHTQIQDWNDLDNIRNNLGDSYVLANDLDENTPGYDTYVSNPSDGWDPIGDIFSEFTGTFDGQGNTISDLTINRGSEDDVGLFGYSEGGTFKGTTLNDVDVTGNENVGSLLGRDSVISGAVVSECSASGSVTGTNLDGDSVGGLVGQLSDGRVELSSSTATVSPSRYGAAGGLIGDNSGVVRDSHATGDVSGDANSLGGLIGYAGDGNVTRSYATGDVSGDGGVGGLIGYAGYCSVDKSWAVGDVSGTGDRVGGFAGESNDTTITDSYAIGDVTGQQNRVGGFVGSVGFDGGITRRVYAAGSVSGSSEVGGLVGRNTDDEDGRLEDSYWDTTTTGQESAVGVSGIEDDNRGLKTGEMQGTDAQTNMGALSFPDIWTAVVVGQEINPVPDSDGYPILGALDAEQQLTAQGIGPLEGIEVDGADNTTFDNVTIANDN